MSQFRSPILPMSGSSGSVETDFRALPPTIPGSLRPPMTPHRGGLVLGLGIASLGVWFLSTVGASLIPCCGGSFLVSIALAISAWAMASADLAAMNAGTMDPAGRGSTQGGRICAIISVVIHALVIFAMLLLLILGIALFGFAAAHHH